MAMSDEADLLNVRKNSYDSISPPSSPPSIMAPSLAEEAEDLISKQT